MSTTNENRWSNDAQSGTAVAERPSEQRRPSTWIDGSAGSLLLGLVFGLFFGFLLQKGGVAKFDILVGVLLLEEFTVVKVMLSAIVVGMVGVYVLNRLGVLEMQVKETVLGANVIGGLIFGVGFGLIAYCPGTGAAAVGQGNLDALTGIVGMIFGSYLFALASRFTGGTVSRWGQLGKVTLPQLAGMRPAVFIAIAAPLLIGVLILLETLL
jgi:hypothetical protein